MNDLDFDLDLDLVTKMSTDASEEKTEETDGEEDKDGIITCLRAELEDVNFKMPDWRWRL